MIPSRCGRSALPFPGRTLGPAGVTRQCLLKPMGTERVTLHSRSAARVFPAQSAATSQRPGEPRPPLGSVLWALAGGAVWGLRVQSQEDTGHTSSRRRAGCFLGERFVREGLTVPVSLSRVETQWMCYPFYLVSSECSEGALSRLQCRFCFLPSPHPGKVPGPSFHPPLLKHHQRKCVTWAESASFSPCPVLASDDLQSEDFPSCPTPRLTRLHRQVTSQLFPRGLQALTGGPAGPIQQVTVGLKPSPNETVGEVNIPSRRSHQTSQQSPASGGE